MPVAISMIDLGNWKITATFGNNNNNNNNNFVDERNYMDEEIDRLAIKSFNAIYMQMEIRRDWTHRQTCIAVRSTRGVPAGCNFNTRL